MARRAKSSNSPNSVLVIFLVFFILSNIGFGVWVYTLIGEREKWDTKAKDLEKSLTSEKQAVAWYRYSRDELLAAMGLPDWYNRSDKVDSWREQHREFVEGKAYIGETDQLLMRDAVAAFVKTLGVSDDGGYKLKYMELPEILGKKVLDLQGKLGQADRDFKAMQTARNESEETYKKSRKELIDMIGKQNSQIFDDYKKSTDAFTSVVTENNKLRADLDKQNADIATTLKKKDGEIRRLIDKIQEQVAIANNPNRALNKPHSLMLDVSSGRALWDTPRGKILRIEDAGRRVSIDKGVRDGIKMGLTFNVFAAGKNGRGEGRMKATIEVIRVDDMISICKVNTVYDADGHEIDATEPASSRALRENDNSIKEGDLLFNLFWGTHVAIVGFIDLTGSQSATPAVQMDVLLEFMRHLGRMGIVVDAYNDLRDGRMVGEITDQTNLIIRGNLLTKKAGTEEDPRAKVFNDNIEAMREQAVNRGLFMISSLNFAVVTGFRPTLGNGVPTLPFVPAAPSGAAGQGQTAPGASDQPTPEPGKN
jgi:hypothetical protein